MPNSYGYGPTRNLTPGVVGNLNKDSGAVGNLSSLVVALGAAVLAKGPTTHAALVARDSDLFDGFGTFLTGLTDLNAQYGAADPALIAANFGTWLQANHVPTYTQILLLYPSAFQDNAGLYDALSGLLGLASELSTAKTNMSSLGTMWTGMPSSGAPFAMVPHAATANLAQDINDLLTWITALKFPAGDGIHVGTGES